VIAPSFANFWNCLAWLFCSRTDGVLPAPDGNPAPPPVGAVAPAADPYFDWICLAILPACAMPIVLSESRLSRSATSARPDMSRKMLGVPSTPSAAASPVGSGAAGGLTMLTSDCGKGVGVRLGWVGWGVTGVTGAISGARCGMGDVCQSQKRVSSISSDALQW